MEDPNFEVFKDEEQRKVLIDMHKAIEASKNNDVLDDLGFEETALMKRDRANLAKVSQVWRSSGRVNGYPEQISIDELLAKDIAITKKMRDNFSTDLPMLIPRTLTNIVREAITPNLVLTPLFTRVNFSAGTRVTFPAWGDLNNAAADIAEGQEYPEGTMELGGETECMIGKVGIAVKVTEEQRRYNQYDMISMNIRACGRALSRLKETKVAEAITANAYHILIDNNDTAYPSSTGRNAAGDYNGTLTLDDMFKAWSTMVNAGFVPNTLIMHPFAWRIFAEDGMSRLFGFQNGNQAMLWNMPQGSVGNAPQWGQTALNNNTWVSNPEQLATTFTRVPTLFPSSFNIIVSPYMPFTSGTNLTDIVFCDVNELGIIVVDEDVTSDEWNDPARDIMKIKFRERYGLAVKNGGRGIGIMRDIKIAKSVDFADRIVVDYTTGSFANPLSGDADYKGTVV